MQILFPTGVQYENLYLYLSDSVNYMKSSFNILKPLYFNMIHVTCLAHMVHLIAEEARKYSKNANDFTNYIKKVFKKSPANVTILKTLFPNP